jgi:hypothetical protein
MREICFILTCLWVACSTNNHPASNTVSPLVGDSSSDHKISVSSAEEDPWGANLQNWHTQYESLLNEILLRNSEHVPFVRMICLPSFEREWVVTIEEPKGDSANVQYLIVKRPIWRDPRPREIETNIAVAQISKSTARKIKLAWIAMLSNRSYMEPRGIGLDGVSYRFATFALKLGVLTREAWSPGREEPSSRLVELGEMLRDFARMEAKDRAEFETSINQKVEDLLSQYPPYGQALQID